MKTSTMDSIGAASAKTSMTAGAVTATFSFMSHEMLFGIIGVLFTLLTFIMSWHYKRKADARADAEAQHRAQEHELRMELLCIRQQQRGALSAGELAAINVIRGVAPDTELPPELNPPTAIFGEGE